MEAATAARREFTKPGMSEGAEDVAMNAIVVAVVLLLLTMGSSLAQPASVCTIDDALKQMRARGNEFAGQGWRTPREYPWHLEFATAALSSCDVSKGAKWRRSCPHRQPNSSCPRRTSTGGRSDRSTALNLDMTWLKGDNQFTCKLVLGGGHACVLVECPFLRFDLWYCLYGR